jgi:hypothetical protein
MSASPTATPSPTATTSGRRRRFVELYGARPWHLLTLLASFALTGYTVSRLLAGTSALVQIAIWFVGSAVLWDVVLGPVLALVDRAGRPLLQRVHVRGVSPLNHVRVPALLSSLLLVVFAPLVFQRSEQSYQSASGLVQDPYLDRWAAVTLALFAGSALAYALAVLRRGSGAGSRRRRRNGD